MGNPIENLGDYNKMRIDLQARNGDLDALYKDVGDTAVAKVAPYLIVFGLAMGMVISKMGNDIIKKIRNEPALKKRFKEEVMTEPLKAKLNDHVNQTSHDNEV